MAQHWIDELILSKGGAIYTGEFTPPIVERELGGGESGLGGREYCAPFGDQTSYLQIPYATLQANGFAIHSGNFTIEARFRVDTLYELLAGDPVQRYAIIGQYVDYLWAGDVNASPGNWWSLEFTDDSFTFMVWDAASQTYKASVTAPISMNWAAEWSSPCHDKLNLDESYVHLAVVRNGSTVRLFVNGVCIGGTAEGTISNWTEITEPLKINGQDGRLNPGLPYSVTYVEELLTFDYARYWDNFVVGDALYSQGAGMCIFPRIAVSLIKGVPGDLSVQLGFSPRIGVSLIKGLRGDMTARFGIPLAMSGSMTATQNEGELLFELPSVTLGLEGVISENGDLLFELPSMTLGLEGVISENGDLDFTMLAPSMALDGTLSEQGELGLSLPTVSLSLNGMMSGEGVLDLVLPKLTFQLTSSAFDEATGEFNISLPVSRFSFSGSMAEAGVLDLVLPALIMELATTPTAYRAMIINLRNQALTEFEEYPFNSMCRFQGRHLATDGARIFDIDGGKYDDGVQVNWAFRTGFLDLERQTKKRLRQAWIGMKTDGEIVVTVVQPDGIEYVYAAEAFEPTETGIRVKFGRGIRHKKYLAIDFASQEGSTLQLDVVRLLLDQFPFQR